MIGEEEIGVLKMNSVSRKEFTGSIQEGVSARICVDEGEVIVHGSSTYSNPNVALHDFSTTLLAGSCRNFFSIPVDTNTDCSTCNVNQDVEKKPNVTLYLTIEGASVVKSQYSLNSSIGNTFGKHA